MAMDKTRVANIGLFGFYRFSWLFGFSGKSGSTGEGV